MVFMHSFTTASLRDKSLGQEGRWIMKRLINSRKDLFTIPNLMGYFRIILIPIFMAVYIGADSRADYIAAAAILGISGLTDCFDGKIARHLNMITEWGKVLDPVADKLTQAAVFISLSFRYPTMRYLVILFVVKEMFMGIMGAIMLKKGSMMDGARWYGKLCTAVLYGAMVILLLVVDLSYFAAGLIISICIIMNIFSFACYIVYYARVLMNKPVTSGKIKMWKPVTAILVFALVYVIVNLAIAVIGSSRQPEYDGDKQAAMWNTDGTERAVIVEDNSEALLSRVRMIQNAQSEIILSTFDFMSDESGRIMLGALCGAADRGVKVNVLVDGFDGVLHTKWNPYFYALSAKENISFMMYNEINTFTMYKGMARMHDKYLIVDRQIYMLGGRNTFNYFLGDYSDYKNYDRDVLVWRSTPAAEQEKASVNELLAYYEMVKNSGECSRSAHGKSLADRYCVKHAAERIAQDYEKYCSEHEELLENYSYEDNTFPVESIALLSNPVNAGVKEPVVWHKLMSLIGSAEDSVKLHTPYIICNDMMYDTLKDAAAGKNVTVMTNSVANNGNSFGAADLEKNRDRMLDTGVTLLEYDGGVSYHGKSMVIDDDISVVGSFNMDMRSAYLDTELMLVIKSDELNAQLRGIMSEYEKSALTALPDGSYDNPDNVVPQEITTKRKVRKNIIKSLLYWARFLF